MQFIRTAFVAIVAYAAAAMLSSHVSMDLTLTHWTSLWTYFWWAVSLPVTAGLFALLVMAGVGIIQLFTR